VVGHAGCSWIGESASVFSDENLVFGVYVISIRGAVPLVEVSGSDSHDSLSRMSLSVLVLVTPLRGASIVGISLVAVAFLEQFRIREQLVDLSLSCPWSQGGEVSLDLLLRCIGT